MAASDLLKILIMVIGTGIAIVSVVTVLNAMLDVPNFNETMGVNAVNAMETSRDSFIEMDNVLLFGFVMWIMASLLLAFVIPTRWYFYVLVMLYVGVVVFILPFFSNAIAAFLSHPLILPASSEFTYLGYFVNYAPIWATVHGGLMAIVLFISGRDGGGDPFA